MVQNSHMSVDAFRSYLKDLPGGADIDIPPGSRVTIRRDVFDMPTDSHMMRKVAGARVYVYVAAPDGGVRVWFREDEGSPFKAMEL